MTNIGLLSNSKGNDYFRILKKYIPSLEQIQENSIEFGKFDCIILTDDLVDGFSSRKAVQDLVKRIKEVCRTVIVLSIWDDTLEEKSELVLVESREPIDSKCRKVIEYI